MFLAWTISYQIQLPVDAAMSTGDLNNNLCPLSVAMVVLLLAYDDPPGRWS